MFRVSIVALLMLLVLCLGAFAEIPKTLNYQGVLTDSQGVVVPDGSYEITFKIWGPGPSMLPLWSETISVAVSKGIFNVTLGESVPLDLPFDQQYYLGISIEGETELLPRIPLSSSPYSMNTICVRGNNIIPASGSIGIGTLAPAETLDVRGGVRIGNSSKTNAGTIRWTGSDFEGYNGSTWLSFTDIGSGTLPSGTSGQTLYNTGSSWAATSNLFNNGTNIGIGTTSPTSSLELMGGVFRCRRNDTQYLDIKNMDSWGTQITGHSPESNKKSVCINALYDESGSPSGETFIRFSVGPESAPLYPMIIKETGRIGIGTINPVRLLEISSNFAYARLTGTVSAGPTFEMKCTDDSADFRTYGRVNFLNAADATEGSINYQYRSYNGVSGMYFTSGGSSPRMVLSETGEVGINTISPTARLDLNGGQLRIREQDTEDHYFEIDNESASSGSFSLVSPQDDKKSLQIRCVHDASGTPFAETWIRFSVGNKFMPTHAMTIRESGNIGIGTDLPSRRLTVRGNILIESESTGDPVAEFGEGLDYAEGFNVSGSSAIDPGTVLVIDPDNPGKLTACSQPYDKKVAGIAAGAKGLGSGVRLGIDRFDCDVALAGRVYCNVDASDGPIEPGDLLTTSGISGYAMKAADHAAAQGAILGKAMEPLERGTKGQILVLVTLQ
jgi:hypothetical protein